MKYKEKDTIFQLAIFLIFFIGYAVWGDWNWICQKYMGEFKNVNNQGVRGNSAFEQEYTNVFPTKNLLISFNGLVRQFVGQREMNSIVRLNNGWLTNVQMEYEKEPVDVNVKGVVELAQYCKINGKIFLYVQPPFNIAKYNDELPIGVRDCHNEALDYLMDRLLEENIDVIDLREEMKKDGVNPYDFFYKTDHHWNMEGGFYAYTKIARWIEENSQTYLDETLLNFDSYVCDVYDKSFLGSAGKRVGIYFGGVDDYHLILPKFPVIVENLLDGSTGNFEDMVINYSELQSGDVFSSYPYDYSYASHSFNQIQSANAQTDLKVLLLTDSYQHGINEFLFLTYTDYNIESYMEVHSSMIDSYDPDVVVMLRYAGNIMNVDRAVRFIPD